jgi:AraC family transcriptional regulator, positive regulator of tynA and feaB
MTRIEFDIGSQEILGAQSDIVSKSIVRFSTTDVDSKDSLDYWVGMICEKYLELQVENTATGGKFWSTLEMAPTGLLRSFHSSGSAQTGVRQRSAAVNCTHASYVLLTSLEKSWTLDSQGTQFSMSPGDLALLDTSTPFHLRYHEQMNIHIHELPRPWVHSWVGETIAQSTPRIDGSVGWGRVLNGLASAFSPEFAASDAFSEELLVNHFGATLALAKRSPISREKVSEGGLDSIVEGVLRLVNERFAEPDLAARQIAKELHISERTLYRSLEKNGHTFFGLLAHKRMSVARRLLLDRSYRDNLSLAEIGKRVGYPQPSQFSRAFSKLEGMTPSQFRQMTQLRT